MAAKSPTKKAAAGKGPTAATAPIATAPRRGSSKSKPAPAKQAPAAVTSKAAKPAVKPAVKPVSTAKAAHSTAKRSAPKPTKSAVKPATSKPATSKPATSKPAAKPATSKPARQTAQRAATSARKPSTRPIDPAPTPSAPKSTKPATDTMPHDTHPSKPKFSKDGLGYTKDFDLAFVKSQYDMLQQERIHLTGQAKRLEDEAHQLVEEAEMGDVQFDDEGGEGDTMVVERERDLALSAQARDAVAEIDAALVRIAEGTYGYSVMSGRPIPKERLEAIPWSSVLVEEKVGGIGRR